MNSPNSASDECNHIIAVSRILLLYLFRFDDLFLVSLDAGKFTIQNIIYRFNSQQFLPIVSTGNNGSVGSENI